MTPDPEEVEKAAKEPEVKPRPEPSEAEYKEASNILWVIEQGGGDMALFLGSILAEKRTAFQARLAEKEAEVERLKAERNALRADFDGMRGRFCAHHGTPGAVRPGCPECRGEAAERAKAEDAERKK